MLGFCAYPIGLSEEKLIQKKSSARRCADLIKPYICKNLIAVIEDPHIKNIGPSFAT
jgi:hypothetical protein